MKCPNCSSTKKTFIQETAPAGCGLIFLVIIFFPIGLLFLLLREKQTVAICQNCGYKWVPSQECGDFSNTHDNDQNGQQGFGSENKYEVEDYIICKNCGNQIFKDEKECSKCHNKKTKVADDSNLTLPK